MAYFLDLNEAEKAHEMLTNLAMVINKNFSKDEKLENVETFENLLKSVIAGLENRPDLVQSACEAIVFICQNVNMDKKLLLIEVIY